jgi:hypothetical protein
MKIYSIGEDAKEHWHWIRPYIVLATDKCVHGWPVAGHLAAVLRGDAFFLVCEIDGEVMGVCKIDICPKALHVNTLAGKDLKKWIQPIFEAVVEIASKLGKEHITSQSRPGIGKMLKAEGCKVQFWSMHRSVG